MKKFVTITESLSGPIRFMPIKNSNIDIGNLIEITEENDNPCCKLSNGLKPFGIVSFVDYELNMISVEFETMVLQTNVFDYSCKYRVGSALYSNDKGEFTTVPPHEDAYILGHVITPPNSALGYLEANWI